MKKINFTMIITVIAILMTLFAVYNVVQKNNAKNALQDEKMKVEQLNQEIENLDEMEDEQEQNTFEEDINWFVTQVYTLENRKKLYENIKDSATDDVIKQLFGDELPPDENQGEVKSIDREVKNVEIYGKYENDKHYKAFVTFDLVYDTGHGKDTGFTILQVDVKKKDDVWVIDKFKEYAKGGNQ